MQINRRENQRRVLIVLAVFLWGFFGYALFKVPRANDPQFHDGILLTTIALTLWFSYLLRSHIYKLMWSPFYKLMGILFKRRPKEQGDYIVNHCQPVPHSAATMTQISQQLPIYCKTLLQHKP